MRQIIAAVMFAGAALAATPAFADRDDDRGREHRYHDWNDGRDGRGHDRRDDRWRDDRRGPPPHWGYRDRYGHDRYRDRYGHDRYGDRYYDHGRAIIIRGFGGELIITPDSRAYRQLLSAPYGFRPNYIYQYSNDCGPRGCRVRVYDPYLRRDYGWISAPRPPRDCWERPYYGRDDRTYRRW
jgi:hypothetical protein